MAKNSRSPDNSRRRRRSRSNSSSDDGDHHHSGGYKRRKSKRSRSRTKEGSHSKSKRSSRSTSRDRRKRHQRSRTRSRSRGRNSRSPSSQSRASTTKKNVKTDKMKGVLPDLITGANTVHMGNLTPEEQLRTKMQMALKAAAEADAQLREKGILTNSKSSSTADSGNATMESRESSNLSIQEQINRSQAIDLINAPGFIPQEYISTHSDKSISSNVHSGSSTTDFWDFENHFPTKSSSTITIDKLIQNELVHENLFANKDIRQEKWVRRLYTMRQKRLNGDIMS